MTITDIILTSVLIITLSSPFLAYYGVRKIRQKKYHQHQIIQKTIFWICTSSVIVLELLVRFSGGSGSLVQSSSSATSPIFNTILTAHIIGAVLTFLIWGYTIFASNKKYKNALPGKFSITHKKLGWAILIGLLYTGISALMVFLMMYDLV